MWSCLLVRCLVRSAVQGDLPASGKVGRPTKKQEKNSNYSLNNASASGLLSCLKRDHPDLAQQVIDGDMSTTKAAREARRVALRTTRCTKRGARNRW